MDTSGWPGTQACNDHLASASHVLGVRVDKSFFPFLFSFCFIPPSLPLSFFSSLSPPNLIFFSRLDLLFVLQMWVVPRVLLSLYFESLKSFWEYHSLKYFQVLLNLSVFLTVCYTCIFVCSCFQTQTCHSSCKAPLLPLWPDIIPVHRSSHSCLMQIFLKASYSQSM